MGRQGDIQYYLPKERTLDVEILIRSYHNKRDNDNILDDILFFCQLDNVKSYLILTMV